MTISVVVPSYRRAQDLARCLAALARQSRLADQIVIVARNDDADTIALAKLWQDRLTLQIVEVAVAGQVHALNQGLAHCAGDIIAITDDDAAPRPDWLARIEAHFAADPRLGGVGGRDWVHERGTVLTAERQLVGRFLWFGRMVGNHHLGAGKPREVHFLKGANCSFRKAALTAVGFDSRLRGAGAQVHNDMAASLAVRRRGWRLLYDPQVAVDHFPAQRFDQDGRDRFDPGAAADRRHNLRLAITELPAWRRAMVVLWLALVGTKSDPGLFHLWRMYLKKDCTGLSRHRAVQNLLVRKDL